MWTFPLLLRKYWKHIAVFSALVVLAFYVKGLLGAKEEAAQYRAQVEYLTEYQEQTQIQYKDTLATKNAEIRDLSYAIDEISSRRDVYEDRLSHAKKTNDDLSNQLIRTLKELDDEALGETCEQQVNWVIDHAETLSQW